MDFQTKLQPQPACHCEYCADTRRQQIGPPPKYAYPCLTFIFIALVVMVLVMLIAPSILVAIHHPSAPRITLTSVEIFGLNISPSTSRITAGDATIKFHVENTNNKSAISYENMQVSLLYRQYILTRAPIQSFRQGARAETEVVAEVKATGERAMDRDVLYEMDQELVTTGGMEGITAQLGARVWYDPGSSGILGWGWQTMWAICEIFRIGFEANGTDGTLSGGPRECTVRGSF